MNEVIKRANLPRIDMRGVRVLVQFPVYNIRTRKIVWGDRPGNAQAALKSGKYIR